MNDLTIIHYEELDEILHTYHVYTVIIAIQDATTQHIDTIMSDLIAKVPNIKYLPRVNNIITFDSKAENFDGMLLLSFVQQKKIILVDGQNVVWTF